MAKQNVRKVRAKVTPNGLKRVRAEKEEVMIDDDIDLLGNDDEENFVDENLPEQDSEEFELIEEVSDPDRDIEEEVKSVAITEDEKLRVKLIMSDIKNIELENEVLKQKQLNERLKLENYALLLRVEYGLDKEWTLDVNKGIFFRK